MEAFPRPLEFDYVAEYDVFKRWLPESPLLEVIWALAQDFDEMAEGFYE